MIHKKLSLYAEFSEFSRKQIKFFTETFKKWANFYSFLWKFPEIPCKGLEISAGMMKIVMDLLILTNWNEWWKS